MKTKNYHFGDWYFKAQFRSVGHGWEVSCYLDKKAIFVGNFIHQSEANRWWGMMLREMTAFMKTYYRNGKTAKAWYGNFMSTHLYKTYYKFLDKLFFKYNKDYTRAFTKNVRKYRTLRKHGATGHRYHVKAA